MQQVVSRSVLGVCSILISQLLTAIIKEEWFYNNVDSSFAWFINGAATARMTLNATAFYVGGTTFHPVIRD